MGAPFDDPNPTPQPRNRWGHKRHLGRAIAIATLTAALLATACTGAAETSSQGVNSQVSVIEEAGSTTSVTVPESTDSTTTTTTTTTTSEVTQVEPASSERSVDTWALANHGNGAQMVVQQVSLLNDQTRVAFDVINGRDFTIRVNARDDDTRLVDAAGRSYALLERFALELDHGDTTSFELLFEPLPTDAGEVTIEFNVRADDQQNIDEGFPGFTFEQINLAADTPTPALPPALPIDDSAVHVNTATFRVQGIGFSETNIGLGFTATNGSGRQVSYSSGHHASFLEDNLGNRHWLKFEGDDRYIRVADGLEATGTMVFAGRIHPDATSLRLVLNVDESTTDDRETTPKYELGPWPLDGSFQAAASLAPIAVDETQRHPNSVSVTVGRIAFGDTGTQVEMTVLNTFSRKIWLNGCCDHTYLIDDLGNRYLVRDPIDNDNLTVDPDQGLEGLISFPGKVDPNATTIELVINDRGEGDLTDDDTAHPEMYFGPFALTRQSGTATSITDVVNFGTRTTYGEDRVQQTEASGLELIFSEFSGVEIPGGVRLTLPEGILFSSGQSRLQSSSRDSIAKIIQILEFYDGDQVVVVGHTDSEGGEDFNQQLSLDRAEAVQQALINAGGPGSLIGVEGAGESTPVADNATESGRAENRRVEIVILTDKGLPS